MQKISRVAELLVRHSKVVDPEEDGANESPIPDFRVCTHLRFIYCSLVSTSWRNEPAQHPSIHRCNLDMMGHLILLVRNCVRSSGRPLNGATEHSGPSFRHSLGVAVTCHDMCCSTYRINQVLRHHDVAN